MEMIKAIVFICQFNGAAHITMYQQLSCQKFYVNCMDIHPNSDPYPWSKARLVACMKEYTL